jgi:histidinol-phosphate phosphatase family protein
MTQKVAFLDRDGTLIENIPYINVPNQVRVLPGVIDGLKKLIAFEFHLVVVSNQSGIKRNLVTREQFNAVDSKFRELFSDAGINFHKIIYCFHLPQDNCLCRKPSNRVYMEIERELNGKINAIMIGDSKVDAEFAVTSNIPFYAVENIEGFTKHRNFLDAVEHAIRGQHHV